MDDVERLIGREAVTVDLLKQCVACINLYAGTKCDLFINESGECVVEYGLNFNKFTNKKLCYYYLVNFLIDINEKLDNNAKSIEKLRQSILKQCDQISAPRKVKFAVVMEKC